MNPPTEELLFQLALTKPAPERAAWLGRECAEDAALCARLDARLAAHEGGSRPDNPSAPVPGGTQTVLDSFISNEEPATVIGQYKILEKVGEGGFGVVYVAEQREPVKRRVALKIIKLGMDTRQVVARFEAERQALALMDHPNIAKVLEAGATETGRPFFVMELVRGVKLTDYCDQNKLSTKQRLELFIPVCQAIQHAHQKGIIHRDIKPSNILVTLHDGVAVPKVIDFGIAKATQQELTEKTLYTHLQQFIGTPAYMSPEQAEMSGLDIDTRSDIYSLGVLLYELLTGSTPFDANELMSQGIDAMRKIIREKEPVRPSTKLHTLQGEELTTTAKRHGVEVSKLVSQLSGDLDWIVMKCLEKDRTRRYETANGLAMDLKRHLNNEAVLARPPSAAYRFQKAFRRNKLAFAAATAVTAALVLGVIGNRLGLIRAERQRREAEAARQLAEQRFLSASRFVEDMFQQVAPKFQDLIGATEAQQALAQISLTFLESLGGTNGGGQAYEGELAKLERQLAAAFGNPYAPNTVGDYNSALRFANQSLAIEQNLVRTHPNDHVLLMQLALTEDDLGSTLAMLGRNDEAMLHFQRNLELLRQLLSQNPGSTKLANWVRIENFRIGNNLMGQNQAQEALDQHYLPYAKSWLQRTVDPTLSSKQAHACSVAHMLVGYAQMQLNQASNALPQFEAALHWKKMLVDREPNNARYARDWSQIHSALGKAQIELGRFDEGLTNLAEAVGLAEGLVQRDPPNGSFQELLADVLQDEAKGCAKIASSPGISQARRAELWRQAIAALTRCQDKLHAPQLANTPPLRLSKERNDVARALNEARSAYAKIAGQSETNASSK